jgi:hypothetical protein
VQPFLVPLTLLRTGLIRVHSGQESRTAPDSELEQRVYSYVVGEPKVRHLLYADSTKIYPHAWRSMKDARRNSANWLNTLTASLRRETLRQELSTGVVK